MPHPGQVVDGKYRLGALLGHGGMGWVFEAVHLQTQKLVALKYLRSSLRLRPGFLERFAREARAAGRIDHPNVIEIYDMGGQPPDVYLVMERLRGKTLRDRLRDGALPVGEALALMGRVLRGVAEAHRLGVVHGDLKPENVFLTVLGDGTPHEPKVLDFGVSQYETTSEADRGAPSTVADAEPGSNVAHTAWAAGTPCYMPLEQLRGEALDARADVHALGVVLYETLMGELPRRSRDRSRLIEELEADDPPSIRLPDAALARRLDAVVARALARRPVDRFQSVAELATAIENARSGVTPGSPRSSRTPRALLAFGVAVVLALAALLGARRSSEQPRATAVETSRNAAAPASHPAGVSSSSAAAAPAAPAEHRAAEPRGTTTISRAARSKPAPRPTHAAHTPGEPPSPPAPARRAVSLQLEDF